MNRIDLLEEKLATDTRSFHTIVAEHVAHMTRVEQQNLIDMWIQAPEQLGRTELLVVLQTRAPVRAIVTRSDLARVAERFAQHEPSVVVSRQGVVVPFPVSPAPLHPSDEDDCG